MKLFLLGLLWLLFSCSSDTEADEMVRQANQFREKQNYTSALFYFQKALKISKNSENKAKISRNIALIYLIKNNKQEAESYFKKGISFADKGTYYSEINKVELLLIQNNIKPSLDLLNKMVDRYADSMEVHNNLSLIYSGSYGDEYLNLNAALLHAKKAFKLYPNEINKEQLAGVLFQKEKFKESSILFHELMNSNPENKMLQFQYGQSLYFDGHEKEGLKNMQDAADRDSECKEMFNDLIKQ